MRETGRGRAANGGEAGAAPLRLRAEDEDDLTVIAACLQDAAVRVADMAYLPKRRRFAVVLNRYRWEAEAAGGGPRRGQRVRAGLHFDGVLAVRHIGFDQSAGDAVLELLTLAADMGGDSGARLTLVFAGAAAVELSVECVDATLHDLTAPWETQHRPEHFLDRGPAARAR